MRPGGPSLTLRQHRPRLQVVGRPETGWRSEDRRWRCIALTASLLGAGLACGGDSDDDLRTDVPGEAADTDGEDTGAGDAGLDDAGYADATADDTEDVVEAEPTCSELVDQLGRYVDEHGVGCSTADDCRALGQVFSEFPSPSCDCNWVLARPSDTWGYGVPFVVLDAAEASIRPLVEQIERECLSWDRCVGAAYCHRSCDVLQVDLRPSCDAGTCTGEIWVDPRICNEPGGSP